MTTAAPFRFLARSLTFLLVGVVACGGDRSTGDRSAGGSGGEARAGSGGAGSGGAGITPQTGGHAGSNPSAGAGGAGGAAASGASGSGGSRDASAGDGGHDGRDASGSADAAPSSSSCGTVKDVIACEDFEAQPVGQIPSKPFEEFDAQFHGDFHPRVSDAHAYSGSRSLATVQRAAIHYLFDKPEDELYARMMMWLSGHDRNHWNYSEAYFGLDRRYAIRFGQQVSSDKYQMNNYYDGGERSFQNSDPNSQFPLGKWICVEMHYSKGGHHELWIDGKLDTAASQPFPPFGSGVTDVVFGQECYDPSDVNKDMHIDDVVIARSRIGCPPPAAGK